MPTFKVQGRYLLFWALASVFLTMTTMVFGSIPLRLARQSLGRRSYWYGALFLSLGLSAFEKLTPLAILFVALVVLVGCFSEVEKVKGISFSKASSIAIFASFAATLLSLAAWKLMSGISITGALQEMIVQQLSQLSQNAIEGGKKIELARAILFLVPGTYIGLLTASLALSLTFERAVKKAPKGGLSYQKLLEFRTPGALVWLACLVVLGAHLDHGVMWLSVLSQNIFFVIIGVYFLQGAAIIVRSFELIKISPFWQALWLVLFFMQFLFVGVLGFVDYWFDFRERLQKRFSKSKQNLGRSLK